MFWFGHVTFESEVQGFRWKKKHLLFSLSFDTFQLEFECDFFGWWNMKKYSLVILFLLLVQSKLFVWLLYCATFQSEFEQELTAFFAFFWLQWE